MFINFIMFTKRLIIVCGILKYIFKANLTVIGIKLKIPELNKRYWENNYNPLELDRPYMIF